jgi:hypothetical protein
MRFYPSCKSPLFCMSFSNTYMYECVCVRERERERERIDVVCKDDHGESTIT